MVWSAFFFRLAVYMNQNRLTETYFPSLQKKDASIIYHKEKSIDHLHFKNM